MANAERRSRASGSARPRFLTDHALPKIRAGRPDEVHRESLALDGFARLVLSLMRWHFQTFAYPDSHGWLMALRTATAHVGPRRAGALVYDVVTVVQALRMARVSAVSFNPEGCACCRDWLTPDERRLMALLTALRKDQQGHARIIAQMLCDGKADTALLSSLQVLLTHHVGRALPGSTSDATQGVVT